MRIVSLLPSATETICSLGLEDQLVGVTHECDYPQFVRGLPKVTRTLIPLEASSAEIDRLVGERLQSDRALYSLDQRMLEILRPDLIVTQALCDVCAVAEDDVRAAACLLPNGPRVINLEPQSLSQVFESISVVGKAANVAGKAEAVVDRLQARVDAVRARTKSLDRLPRVALLEWLDPPFSCGNWSPELVGFAGGYEGLGREGQPSRRLGWEEVVEWQPEVVFIACCGFGIERTMENVPQLLDVPGWRQLPAFQQGKVYITDGSSYFSRPGPRLVDSLEILAHAIHPKLHPLPAGLPQPVSVLAPSKV